EIRRVVLTLMDHRYKEIGREDQYGSAESWWRYADDGKSVFVELDNTTHNAAVILKMTVPIRIGEHDICSMLIGGVKQAAKVGRNAQYLEVVRADFIDPGPRWIFTGIESRPIDVVGRQALKAAVAIAQIEIIGVRLTGVLVA